MNTNGNPDSILEAEQQAKAHQHEIPPPYVPSPPPADDEWEREALALDGERVRRQQATSQDARPAAEKPKALTPFSPEFFEANIGAQQQLVNQRYNDWQQALGALNALVAMRDLALQHATDAP